MKHLLLTSLLVIAFGAQAATKKTKTTTKSQTPTTETTVTPTVAPETNTTATKTPTAGTPELLKDVSLFGFYNLADNSSFEGSTTGIDFSGNMTSNSSYGMGIDAAVARLDNGLNIKAGASYEFNRIFNKVQTRAKGATVNTTFDSPKPELTAWIFTLNGELPIRPNFAIFGGANFNSPKLKNTTGTYTGKFGWQVGASLTMASNLYVDGMWRSFNMSGSDDNITFDNVNTSGFIVRGRIGF
jgi:hypothetical protein